jgi:hypothetical protein
VVFGKSAKHPEFKAEYLGGHSAFPKKKDVKLILEPDQLVIEKMGLSFPYKQIKNIENMTKDKISAKRVILLGVIGALWKKEKIYMVLTVDDPVAKKDQDMVFDVEKIEEAQPLIYQKVTMAKS